MLVLRCWTAALQVAKVPVLSSCICQSCCISEWFVLAVSVTLLRLTAPILLSPLSLQIAAPKLCFWTIHWGAHLATSSFLSSDFFSLALYPQKGIALLWHSFSMTDPSALTSYLLSALPWLLGFPFFLPCDVLGCQNLFFCTAVSLNTTFLWALESLPLFKMLNFKALLGYKHACLQRLLHSTCKMQLQPGCLSKSEVVAGFGFRWVQFSCLLNYFFIIIIICANKPQSGQNSEWF